MKQEKLVKYNWKQFDDDIEKIVKNFKIYKGIIKNIYGIPRGGLCLAVKLSHYLDIPLIVKKGEINANTLIVDDIYDSGETIKKLIYGRKYFAIITLWINKENKKVDLPLTYIREKNPDEWIIYPWEK